MIPTRPMLNYYGGKWNAGPWIIDHLPEHEIYCEPFGGGAAVLLQKPRSKREIINDIDDEIVNLYMVMRDHFPELQRRLKLTPHSRTEYLKAYRFTKRPIERARRSIVKSYFGIGDSQFHKGNGMRSSKTSNTCVAKSWANYVDHSHEISERFRGVTIECLDYRSIIAKYDSSKTLFYMDPPYHKATRSTRHAYRHDFESLDQEHFLNAISGLKGMVAVSGYDHPMYSKLGWHKEQCKFKTQSKTFKVESLWLSPSAAANSRQMSMWNE